MGQQTQQEPVHILYPAKKWFKTKEAEVLLNGNPPTYYCLASKRGASLLAFWTDKESIDKNDDNILPCNEREMELLDTLDPLNYTGQEASGGQTGSKHI